MKRSYFFLLLTSTLLCISLTLSTSSDCPAIRCSTIEPDISQTCFDYHNSSEIIIRTCPNGSRCVVPGGILSDKLQEGSRYHCSGQDVLYAADWRFPGSSCEIDEECTNGKCDEDTKICLGQAKGSSCDHITQLCDAGLVCSEGTCTSPTAIGGQCNHNDECTNDGFCSKSVCTKYLTLPLNTKTDIDTDDTQITTDLFPELNIYCESMWINNMGICSAAPHSLKDYSLTPCGNSTDCARSDSQYSQCLCGLNAEGDKYCQRAPGDPVFLKIRSTIRKIMAKNQKCHRNARFSAQCKDITDLVGELDDLSRFAAYGHRIFGNSSSCIESQFNLFQNLEKLRTEIPYFDPTYNPGDVKEEEKPVKNETEGENKEPLGGDGNKTNETDITNVDQETEGKVQKSTIRTILTLLATVVAVIGLTVCVYRKCCKSDSKGDEPSVVIMSPSGAGPEKSIENELVQIKQKKGDKVNLLRGSSPKKEPSGASKK